MGVGSVVGPLRGVQHCRSAIGSDLAGDAWEARQRCKSDTMVARPHLVWR